MKPARDVLPRLRKIQMLRAAARAARSAQSYAQARGELEREQRRQAELAESLEASRRRRQVAGPAGRLLAWLLHERRLQIQTGEAGERARGTAASVDSGRESLTARRRELEAASAHRKVAETIAASARRQQARIEARRLDEEVLEQTQCLTPGTAAALLVSWSRADDFPAG